MLKIALIFSNSKTILYQLAMSFRVGVLFGYLCDLPNMNRIGGNFKRNRQEDGIVLLP